MKRSKSSVASTVKPSTSAEHENVFESDEENAEVTVVEQCSYKTYFKYETKNNEKVGICLLCQKENIMKEIKMKNSNTTGLKKHLEKTHKKAYVHLFGSKAIKHKILSEKQKSMDIFLNTQNPSSGHVSDRMLVSWLAYKRLPFTFFDDEVTQKFFQTLNPNISMPKRNIMKEKVMTEYIKMKDNLKEILSKNDSKFSFTIDGWTAPNFESFYGVTIHFIDNNWTFQSLALDFVPANGKHSGKDIANLFLNIIKDYGIQKRVQGITLDNAAANTTFIHELGALLNNEGIIFDVENQHFRCFAHIINLAVQDVLKLIKVDTKQCYNNPYSEINEYNDNEECEDENEHVNELSDDEMNENEIFSYIVNNIRNTCKKIRRSEQLTIRLKLFCDAVNIKFIKPVLDVKTRWDSTYDMLNTALLLKPALIMMWDNCSDLSNLKVAEKEWIILEKIVQFLKHFKYVSKMLSSDSNVTLPTVVLAFNMLVDKIESVTFNLNDKFNRDIQDETLLLAFQAGRDKLIKHYRKCNWIYCISLILDPRHKAEGFDVTSWGKELKDCTILKFEDIYRSNYYIDNFSKADNKSQNIFEYSPEDKDDDLIDISAVYLHKKPSAVLWKTEINYYLQAPRECIDINILKWWESQAHIYPTLSKMARDILSSTASSVPVERLFSIGALTMTKNRTRLQSQSLKALMCINSWMKCLLMSQICGFYY